MRTPSNQAISIQTPSIKTPSTKTTVLKIGGASLFAPQSEFNRLIDYLKTDETLLNSRVFLIVGGGETVESMRLLHGIYPQLDPIAMHWRCIELLDATWQVASELMDFCQRIPTTESLQQAFSSHTPSWNIVRPGAFYSPILAQQLPANISPDPSWETTTDALAWLLAILAQGDEVLLIKKANCSSIKSLAQAAACGIVDPEIHRLHQTTQHPSISFLYDDQGWKIHPLDS
jgi:aspartokinase-like uncharacterized kinase